MTPEQIARRYPWSEIKDENPIHCGPGVEKTAACVCWIVPDSSPGMYGWRSVQRSFLTVEGAIAVAKKPMGIAKEVYVREFDWTVKQGPGSVKISYRRKNSAYKRKSK